MRLYDGKSSIRWFVDGEMTVEQMKDDDRFETLLAEPCVLFDDGIDGGFVFGYGRLADMAAEWMVVPGMPPEQTFGEIIEKMKGTYRAPGVAEAEEKAATAQTTADEAKEIASQAGTDPQVMAFARMAVLPMAATMTDEQALSVSTLWPEWSAASVEYKVDDVVQHADHLWRCEQAHTSQESWTPDAAPSLWSQIDIAGDGVDVWTQPTGAHNAYNTGDRVHYPTADDPIYVSLIDGNVWAPDAYPAGWQLEQSE